MYKLCEPFSILFLTWISRYKQLMNPLIDTPLPIKHSFPCHPRLKLNLSSNRDQHKQK